MTLWSPPGVSPPPSSFDYNYYDFDEKSDVTAFAYWSASLTFTIELSSFYSVAAADAVLSLLSSYSALLSKVVEAYSSPFSNIY